MHSGRHYKLQETLFWTRREIGLFAVMATVPTVLYAAGLEWVAIPFLPVTLLGTAVAFLVGFKSNASYDRLWEARKIWGAIVNESRSWGALARDFVRDTEAPDPVDPAELAQIRRRLLLRHVAWLTALRFQLRQPRTWEHQEQLYNREFRTFFVVPELAGDLGAELEAYLEEEEHTRVMGKKNRATAIIAEQSRELVALRDRGLVNDFQHVRLTELLGLFYTHQGKCERIKNFPYPRQYASMNLYFVWTFLLVLPFGMLNEFAQHGMLWLNVPFCVLVMWVFFLMERIGEASENPFEGGANDIPMAALSRTIEIDLLDMLDAPELPTPVRPQNLILM